MNYYTGDLHLFHAGCINFDNRPFKDVEDMNKQLVQNWNNKVTNRDTVYILGDLCFERKDIEAVNKTIKSLNGKKILIRGNHDYFLDKQGYDTSLLEVHPYLKLTDTANGNKYQLILFHFPIYDWDRRHHGSIHLYAHTHTSHSELSDESHPCFLPNAYNVGCMHWNYEPVTLQEILSVKQYYQQV